MFDIDSSFNMNETFDLSMFYHTDILSQDMICLWTGVCYAI